MSSSLNNNNNGTRTVELGALKIELAEKENAAKLREQKCLEQARKIELLNHEMASMEAQLNKSYNDTLDQMARNITDLQSRLVKANKEADLLQIHAAQLEKEKQVTEAKVQQIQKELAAAKTQLEQQDNAAQDQISNLEFRLSESNRVAKFLQDNASKAHELKLKHEAQIKALEQELAHLTTRLQQNDKDLEERTKSLNEQSAKMNEILEQVANMEARLTVANQVASFLKSSLMQSESEKKANQSKAQQVDAQLQELKAMLKERDDTVAVMEFQLSEAGRISKFIHANLVKTQEEKRQVEAKVQETEQKVDALVEQIKVKDQQIYKDSFELTGTTRVLRFVQTSLAKCKEEMKTMENELEGKVATTEFRLTETNRVLTFVQNSLTKTKQEKQELENALEAKIATLDFRLSEAVRVAKFLQTSSTRLAEEKRVMEIQAKDLTTQLNTTKAKLEQAERENREQLETSAEQATKVKELTDQVADLDARLCVAHRVTDFLKTSLSRMDEEKRANDAKAIEVEAELASVKSQLQEANEELYNKEFQLTGTNRVLEFTQKSLAKTKADKEEMENRLEGELAQKDFRLTETKRVLGFIQNSLAKTKAEKEANENQLEGKVAEVEFRLSEATRVAKFLQTSVSRVQQEKSTVEAKANELQSQVESLTTCLEDKISELQSQEETSVKQVEEIEKSVQQLTELECRLYVTNRVADFLQTSLSEAEEEKRLNDIKTLEMESELELMRTELQEATEKLYAREFELTGTKRVLNFVQSSLQATKEEKEKMENRLEGQIAEKEFRLTEANRVLNFVQSSLAKVKDEKAVNENDLEGRIAQFEFRLSEATRVAKFLQSKAMRLDEEKRLAESQMKTLEAEIAALRAKSQAHEVEIEIKGKTCADQAVQLDDMAKEISDLKSRLSVTSSVAEFLQNSLMKAEERRRLNESKVGELEGQLSNLHKQLQERDEKIANIQFQVSESMRIAKFLQDRVARTEVEKKFIDNKAQELEHQLDVLKSRLQETGQGFVGLAFTPSAF